MTVLKKTMTGNTWVWKKTRICKQLVKETRYATSMLEHPRSHIGQTRYVSYLPICFHYTCMMNTKYCTVGLHRLLNVSTIYL